MNPRLIACGACGRHVKEGDTACPFCGAEAPVAGPLPRLAGVRLTRAAMIAAGTAGTVAGLIDCSDPSAQAVPFYGNACVEDGSCAATYGDAAARDAAPDFSDGGSGAVFYGLVCTGNDCDGGAEDATSLDASADGTSDAQTDAATDALGVTADGAAVD